MRRPADASYRLKALDMRDCGMGPGGVAALASLLQGCSGIRSLVLAGNDLGDEGACKVGQAGMGKRSL